MKASRPGNSHPPLTKKQLARPRPKNATRTAAASRAPEPQAETQERFDAAIREGVSPCMWIPPKWDDLELTEEQTTRRFADNSTDAGDFKVINALIDKAGERKVQAPEALPTD